MISFDIAVIGGGVVGGMLTRTLSARYPNHKIGLFEKESGLGLHTSTRNSAVLHAGFYYASNTVKASLCREGNKTLTQYCLDHKVNLRKTGKFLVARNSVENERLAQIKKQGDINGVELELMEVDRALKIEKYLKVNDKNFQFLYSPTTSVADNKGLMKSIHEDLKQCKNVQVFTNHKYTDLIENKDQQTLFNVLKMPNEKQLVSAKYFINAGGLYADVIAKQFNFCNKYVIWPFKGSYLINNRPIPEANAIIYPVPPLAGNYFLGIHTTLTTDGHLKIGPSIFPALWREQYNWKDNFVFSEFSQILSLNVQNVLSKDMKFYAQSLLNELKKINKTYMIKEAKKLTTQLDQIPENQLHEYFDRGKPGIRSQLFDTEQRKMEQDFIFEHDKNSFHLLNVASPGWTCSIPMSEYICDIISKNNYI
ncbi:unnamed protein product (macronuclear) [Paramecium tetraurelia]|uniref:L-2-hydroxyglutarate dehydrogenase, mitochondrial n=1 Tax=Paramecium tetraurelia TaxID=5888 RepID=A0BR38_PARTE|nr:uncharacterized protein GSPATT00031234001 [Paramecium tetraurelia]CAK61005.1 unnamed protein product [Paramecium tetraurelia]|eukprot:XP_001428403.1 hypothetical protein (macronuclear) [Paramecium tetraurelia strain d4-2]